ncbi:helix-turn-helix domain-containing protein [Candidatus Dependentiae bacterium]|nr:helix-turn-helix domain-containing protein [Candidatus Dependentiae bacterium]
MLLKKGISQKEIARAVNASQSTISNKLKRNTGGRGYRYKQAQQLAANRRKKASLNRTYP